MLTFYRPQISAILNLASLFATSNYKPALTFRGVLY
jgi:hypothetical protein